MTCQPVLTRRTLLAVGTVMCGLALSGCDTLVGVTYRYRLTVDVDTPKGLRSGTTVVEVKYWRSPAFPSLEAGGLRSSFRGEAVAVDLPDGQTLFVLLNNAKTLAHYAFGPFMGQMKNGMERAREIKNFERAIEIPIVGLTPGQVDGPKGITEVSEYPIFVRFKDTRDRTTIERVDPANLAAAFGEGVTLRRMVIQITDQSPSSGMVKRLPWLKSVRPGMLSEKGTMGPPLRLSDIVDTSDFSTEIHK